MGCPLCTRSTNGLLTTYLSVVVTIHTYPSTQYSIQTQPRRDYQAQKRSFLHLTFSETDRVQSPRPHIDSAPLDVLGSTPEQSSRSFCKSTDTDSGRQSRFLAVQKRNVQNFGRFGFVRLGLADLRLFGVLRGVRSTPSTLSESGFEASRLVFDARWL